MAGGGGDIDTGFVTQAKNEAIGFLDKALRAAIPYSELYTKAAIDVQRQMIDVQRDTAKEQILALTKYSDLSRADQKEYYERGMAMGAPYREAGYRALDNMQDILGMARPSSGSSALAKALEDQAKRQSSRSQLQASGRDLLSRLNLSPNDRQNALYAMTAGNNPMGIAKALSYLQAKPTDPSYDPQFSPARLTQAGDYGASGSGGGSTGGSSGGGGDWQTSPVLGQSYQSLFDNTNANVLASYKDLQGINAPISQMFGDPIANYAMQAYPQYQSLQQSTAGLNPATRSLLSASATGFGGLTPQRVSVSDRV